MSTSELVTPRARPRACFALLDRAVLKVMARVLARAPGGRLHLTLPSGRSGLLGPADMDVAADLAVSSYRVLWQSIRRGSVGFADSYISGDFDTSDLEQLFNYYLASEQALIAAGGGLTRSARRDRVYHRKRSNTRTGSRRNIAAHYDLGNAFYKAWLDDALNYSSAIYRDESDTLERAQQEKYDCILAALEIGPEHALLEIGCGWGGFAAEAARQAGRVTGITISLEQHAEAKRRIAQAGLGPKVDIRFEDYRDTKGTFHRIASIEMIEAVGEEHWPVYFETIARRLAPGGKAVLQAITIRPDLYESYRRNPDFIQCYIFPGGMLPTEDAMRRQAEAAGLRYERIETFGRSYALTLAEWRRRFLEAWPLIAAMGFDERFRRMWLYYLSYCQVGFERGTIDVGLYRFTKDSGDAGSSNPAACT